MLFRSIQDALKRHVAAHDETLNHIAEAVAIFGPTRRLSFHNTAFADLWGLDPAWLAELPGTQAGNAVIGVDADAAMLDSLRALRTRLAREQNVPAYVVFSDRTLVELATHRPTTPAAMREIHGIGDTKLERYGSEFLAIIQPRRS